MLNENITLFGFGVRTCECDYTIIYESTMYVLSLSTPTIQHMACDYAGLAAQTKLHKKSQKTNSCSKKISKESENPQLHSCKYMSFSFGTDPHHHPHILWG